MDVSAASFLPSEVNHGKSFAPRAGLDVGSAVFVPQPDDLSETSDASEHGNDAHGFDMTNSFHASTPLTEHYEEELNELRFKLDELRARYAKLELENRRFASQLVRAKLENIAMDESPEVDDLLDQNDELRCDNKSLRDEITQLRLENRRSSEALFSARMQTVSTQPTKEIESLRSNLNEEKSRRVILEIKLAETTAQLNDISLKKQQLEEDALYAVEEIQRFTEQLQRERETTTELREQLLQSKGALRRSQTQASKESERAAQLQKQLEQAQPYSHSETPVPLSLTNDLNSHPMWGVSVESLHGSAPTQRPTLSSRTRSETSSGSAQKPSLVVDTDLWKVNDLTFDKNGGDRASSHSLDVRSPDQSQMEGAYSARSASSSSSKSSWLWDT
ncbi:MAG: hypothetical protein MHM6MM_001689 [Cercozoa sp. M6MM]